MRIRIVLRSAPLLALALVGVSDAAAQRPGQIQATQAPAPTPRAWIGLAFTCGDCGFRMDPQGGSWFFSSPPEIYSVEPGSPAFEAGMRRGDVLTHVDDEPITSVAAGRRWARLGPGEVVRLRYDRGPTTRYANVRTEEPRGMAALAASRAPGPPAPDARALLTATRDTTARRTVEEAQRLLQEQSRQERTLRELEQRLRSTALTPLPQDSQRQLIQSYVTEQARVRTAQRRQIEELLRAHQVEQQARSAEAAARTLVPLTSAQWAASIEERLRYSGSIGGADVEVRSASPVTVTETADELLIRVGDTVVRLRRQRE